MAGRNAIQIEGLRELRRALRAYGDEATDGLRAAHKDAAEVVERRADSLAPVRSGTLQGTLRSSGTLTAGRVRLGYARVPYAGPIHFGTPNTRGRPANIRPNPFLYDALDDRRQQVIDVFFDRLEAVKRQQGL